MLELNKQIYYIMHDILIKNLDINNFFKQINFGFNLTFSCQLAWPGYIGE